MDTHKMIHLHKVTSGEATMGWHLAVIAAAVQRGWFPTVYLPFRGHGPMAQDVNSAIDYLVATAPLDFDRVEPKVLDNYAVFTQ